MKPKLLAVSFAYPPLPYPQAVQIARLLAHADAHIVVVCADEQRAPKDPTTEPPANSGVEQIRVPFSLSGFAGYCRRALYRSIPILRKKPDRYCSWIPQAVRAIETMLETSAFKPDLLVTFGNPMSDHVIGLEVHSRYGLPWIAHFSDPWVDNPFESLDPLSRRINHSLEERVIQAAHRLVFTTEETVDLVMRKYPKEWRTKARILPHSFDSSMYPPSSKPGDEKLNIRYVGHFYGPRTPQPLIRSLQSLSSTDSYTLQDVRFELIGRMDCPKSSLTGLKDLPPDLLELKNPVAYVESLSLMLKADGLLVIDAPADISVFLPSKLADYIGAERPVLGLTPSGAAARLIQRMGGWVVDPTDVAGIADRTREFLDYLRQCKRNTELQWGNTAVREEYAAPAVASKFDALVEELLESL